MAQTATQSFRWIAYLANPLGGGEWERVTSLEDAKVALIAYGRNTGFYQDLTVYGDYGPVGYLYPYGEQEWEDAQASPGNPFDYPSYRVESGPCGGVSVTRA